MTLDALCTPGGDVLIYDTFNAAAAAAACAAAAGGGFPFGDGPAAAEEDGEAAEGEVKAQQARRKRRRRGSVKNREDAESQRVTHIAVERNRRRQMSEYLAALRSLMPAPYIQRGDQASIVSGAIDFVKDLEQQVQSLELQKRALLTARRRQRDTAQGPMASGGAGEDEPAAAVCAEEPPPFARFFRYPQYVWRHAHALPREEDAAAGGGGGGEPESRATGSGVAADIEVSVVVDAHATLRVMAPRRPGQLLGMVAGMQALGLAVLHLNVVTAPPDALALYTLSLKVEEGCGLTTADDIAAAVHRVLCIIGADHGTAAAQRQRASG
ncbi:hypothetical protein ACP4OV_031326 [Aristida adscensionis]